MLLWVNRHSIEHSQLAQVEDTVDPVVVSEVGAHKVSGNIQDYESLQILQFYRFLDIADEIVAQVELHEALEFFQAVKSGDLVIFKGELREADEHMYVRNPLDLVGSQVKLLEILQVFEVLYSREFVLFKAEFFKHSQILQALDHLDVVVE